MAGISVLFIFKVVSFMVCAQDLSESFLAQGGSALGETEGRKTNCCFYQCVQAVTVLAA